MTTDNCQAVTAGNKVSFHPFDRVALDLPAPKMGVVNKVDSIGGLRCRKLSHFACMYTKAEEVKSCREHLADLVDAVEEQWDGSLIAVRKIEH